MFRWKRAAAATAVIAAGAIALSGCSSSISSTSPSGGPSGTLSLGVLAPDTTFQASNMNWANESAYGQAVYDTLVQASPTGTIEPHLATAWTLDAAKTTLTLTLRTGIKFTDGTAFNATVAAANLMAFKKGTSDNAAELVHLDTATAIDPTHVALKLSQPDPAMLTYLSQNAGLMESTKAFSNANVKTVPVGSGPYVLDTKDTVVGSSYVFTRNTKYWDKAEQHYGKIVMNVYASGTALLNAIQGGQLNAANTFDNTTNAQIKAAGFTISPLEYNWEGLLLLDRDGTMNKAIGNVKVRQAINMAFNRPALLKAVANGYGTVTEQVFPTSSPSYDKSLDSTYAYDPAKAKALLAEAGYPNGFTLDLPSVSAFASVNALVAGELGAIGIKVVDHDYPFAQLFSSILAPKYPAAQIILGEDPTDWQLSQSVIDKTATWNPFHVTNPTVAGDIKTIQIGSASDAAAAGKSLDAYLVKNAWFAPWFRPQESFASDAKTKVTVQVGNALPYLWNIEPK